MSKDRFVTPQDTETAGSPSLARRLVPIGIILSGIALFFALGLNKYITLESLRENRLWLLGYVERNSLLAAVSFFAVYTAIAAFSVPGAAVTSITGGFLFGVWAGTALNIVSATFGATLLFLAARTSLADLLRRRAGPWLVRFEEGFSEAAISYLLALRLMPGVPFFIVNLVPAFIGVSLRLFVLTTFFGIMPGAFVYTAIGASLSGLLEDGGEISFDRLLTPDISIALGGLGILSLLPVAYRLWRRYSKKTS